MKCACKLSLRIAQIVEVCLNYLPDPSQRQGQVQPQLNEVQDPDKQEQVQDLTSSRPTPMPPEEYHDTAGGKDLGEKNHSSDADSVPTTDFNSSRTSSPLLAMQSQMPLLLTKTETPNEFIREMWMVTTTPPVKTMAAKTI